MGANQKRLRHIEEVLARKKEEARAAASEEARKQAMWEERKRIREEEEKAAASGVKRAVEKVQDAVSVEVDESRWDRLMNGGGKKKKAKKAPALFKGDAAARDAADSRGGGSSKRPGEDSVSVRTARARPLPNPTLTTLLSVLQIEETNRMRAALGMAPLK